MKAAILCAGLGTRLRPLTDRWPKPALPLLGQPLIRYSLAVLKRAGITEVAINTHHLPTVMRDVASDECARLGIHLQVVHEPVIQGTAGGIRGLKPYLDSDPFVMMNGDIVFPIDLRPLIAAHRQSRALATMILMEMPAGQAYQSVEMDAAGRIWRIAGVGEHRSGLRPWHFTGVHLLSPEVFDLLAKEGPEDINRQVYPRAISSGRAVRGDVVSGYWSDLGTPDRYLRTQEDLLRGVADASKMVGAAPFADASPFQEGSWIRGDPVLEGKLVGPVFADGNCRLARGSRVGPSVYVGPGAHVEAGAQVERAALLEATHVRAGEKLAGVIAWSQGRLSEGGGPP